ncbi:MAG: hypothetical protein K8F25_13535 [Fimbriimonadaceae bacterium]|nr:hypothetical protein [Alphaproteobacteria bacterium]
MAKGIQLEQGMRKPGRPSFKMRLRPLKPFDLGGRDGAAAVAKAVISALD